MQKNGQKWYDDQGNAIQAHGGMILYWEGIWYWYGENKGKKNNEGKTRVDVIGISCYSSKNLTDWHDEGIVLDTSQKNTMMRPENVCERPKVVYNEGTGKFVLWTHIDTPDYLYAGVQVATADTPTGPFTIIRTMRPNRNDSRDMTIFTDRDGKAYLIHSSNMNKQLDVAQLTDDFCDLNGFYVSILVDQEREAPAIIYQDGLYYMISSGCTGWQYNSALYATSEHLLGKWKLIDNPCEGEGYRNTFQGQSTFLLKTDQQVFLMLDHWKPDHLQDSGYSLLPVSFENGRMTVKWMENQEGI